MPKNFHSRCFVHCFSVSCVAIMRSVSEVSYCIKCIWPMVRVGRGFELLGACILAWHSLGHNMEEKGKGNLSIGFVHKGQRRGWNWFIKTSLIRASPFAWNLIQSWDIAWIHSRVQSLYQPNITFHQADNNSMSSRSHFSQGSPCSVAPLRIQLQQMNLSAVHHTQTKALTVWIL